MKNQEWSGRQDPADPDNFWIDDETGERVDAVTGERSPLHTERQLCKDLEFFCGVHGLPLRSADELLHEELTDEQRRWLSSSFILLWDDLMEREQAARVPA